MKHIKTPVMIVPSTATLIDADNIMLCEPPLGPVDSKCIARLVEIGRIINTFDSLLSTCKLIKQFLDAMRVESGVGNVLLPFEKLAFEQVDEAVSKVLEQVETE